MQVGLVSRQLCFRLYDDAESVLIVQHDRVSV